jgi:hypothetical protein
MGTIVLCRNLLTLHIAPDLVFGYTPLVGWNGSYHSPTEWAFRQNSESQVIAELEGKCDLDPRTCPADDTRVLPGTKCRRRALFDSGEHEPPL